MRGLFKYLKEYKKHTIIGSLLKLLEAVFEVLIPFIMAKMINLSLFTDGDYRLVFIYGIVIIILVICGYVCALICQRMASIVSAGFGKNIRLDMYSHIEKLKLIDVEKYSSTSLSTRIGIDVTNCEKAIAYAIRLLSRVPFLILGAIVMSLIINIYFGLVFIGIAIILIFGISVIVRKSIKGYTESQSKFDDISKIVLENIDGVKSVRSYLMEEEEIISYEKEVSLYNSRLKKATFLTQVINPFTYLIINVAVIVVLYMSGVFILSNKMLVGDVSALVNYMNMILLALLVMAMLIVVYTKAFTSAKRINEILNIKVDEETTNTIIKDNLKIEFKNLSFGYSSNLVLNNINLVINPNEHIGIIGPTSSGKSSLVNLLIKLYEINNEGIYINGNDINYYVASDLRKNISLISQEAYLLDGSILDHFKLRDSLVSLDEVKRIIKIAKCEKIVSDKSLDYIINNTKLAFSLGEIQRLCIGRGLVGEFKLLIFDDCFSALDNITEKEILESILNEYKCGIIFISQRIDTIKKFKKIIVMNEGRIECIGNHEQLLDKSITYKTLYDLQVGK